MSRHARTARESVRALLLAAVYALTPIAATRAQGWQIRQPSPDCDLTRRAYENPFTDGHHYIQPRLAWHIEYAVGSIAVAYVVHRLGLPRWASTLTAIGLGVAPHIRSGLIQRRYPINPGDVVFDVWDRAVPAYWASGAFDDTTSDRARDRAHAVGVWLGGYVATACFASP